MQLSTGSSAQVADTGSCVVIGQDVPCLGSVRVAGMSLLIRMYYIDMQINFTCVDIISWYSVL